MRQKHCSVIASLPAQWPLFRLWLTQLGAAFELSSSLCVRLVVEAIEDKEDAEEGRDDSREGEIGLPPAMRRGGLRVLSVFSFELESTGLSALLSCPKEYTEEVGESDGASQCLSTLYVRQTV